MTQATPNPARDTRPTVAGHPLPWNCAIDDASGQLIAVVDADEKPILNHLHERQEAVMPDRFYAGLVIGVNKIAADLAREKQETEDLRKVILDSLENDRHANEAMAKALRLQPGEQFLIPVAERLHTRIAALEAALEWYAHQVAGCRKLGSIGDPARQALDKDGGQRAMSALGLAHRLDGNPTDAEQVTA